MRYTRDSFEVRSAAQASRLLAMERSELEQGSPRRSRGRSRVSEDPLGGLFGAPGDRKSRFGGPICVPEAAIRCENASDLSAAKVRSLATPLRARKTRFSQCESPEKRSGVCRTYCSNFALRFIAITLRISPLRRFARSRCFSECGKQDFLGSSWMKNEATCSEHIRTSSRSLPRGRRTWPQAA